MVQRTGRPAEGHDGLLYVLGAPFPSALAVDYSPLHLVHRALFLPSRASPQTGLQRLPIGESPQLHRYHQHDRNGKHTRMSIYPLSYARACASQVFKRKQRKISDRSGLGR